MKRIEIHAAINAYGQQVFYCEDGNVAYFGATLERARTAYSAAVIRDRMKQDTPPNVASGCGIGGAQHASGSLCNPTLSHAPGERNEADQPQAQRRDIQDCNGGTGALNATNNAPLERGAMDSRKDGRSNLTTQS